MIKINNALILGSIAAFITTLGIMFVYSKKTAEKYNSYIISFATGIILTITIVHLIPKSLSLSTGSAIYILAGFALMHATDRFINYLVCDDDHAIGIIPVIGIGFHSFMDGAIFSVAFNVGLFTGLITSVSMIMHELPEGISVFLLLSKSFEKNKSFLIAFIAAALTTPLGALFSDPFIKTLPQKWIGLLLALSAGALLYVSAAHLLPRFKKKTGSLFLFLCGIFMGLAIIYLKGAV